MQLANAPSKLVIPFANGGGKNTIPVASQIGITNGAASLTDGFPPLTRTPLAAGGVPPSGLDMNGILYAISAISQWLNAGGSFPYDSTFASNSNVGGYPAGAQVLRSDNSGFWLNTVDGNSTNPESAGALAAGWIPSELIGSTTLTMTSASVTLTPLQYGHGRIIITGALTSNLQLVFPNLPQSWMVVNNCTGNYYIVCKTGSGTGVNVPAGVTVTVYGDGVNIYSPDTNTRMTASAYASAQQTIASGGAKVVWNTVEFDNYGLWNSSNNRFQAINAGRYRFSGATYLPSVAGNDLASDVYVNGSLAKRCCQFPQVSDVDITVPFNVVLNLNAGDYVESYLNASLASVSAGMASGSSQAYVYGQFEYLGK